MQPAEPCSRGPAWAARAGTQRQAVTVPKHARPATHDGAGHATSCRGQGPVGRESWQEKVVTNPAPVMTREARPGQQQRPPTSHLPLKILSPPSPHLYWPHFWELLPQPRALWASSVFPLQPQPGREASDRPPMPPPGAAQCTRHREGGFLPCRGRGWLGRGRSFCSRSHVSPPAGREMAHVT